jgi:hypothetical protein
MDLLMLMVNASLSGMSESIEQANSARLCRYLLVQAQDGLTLARFGKPTMWIQEATRSRSETLAPAMKASVRHSLMTSSET